MAIPIRHVLAALAAAFTHRADVSHLSSAERDQAVAAGLEMADQMARARAATRDALIDDALSAAYLAGNVPDDPKQN